MYCKIPTALAYLMLIYILACVYYMIMTRNIGTHFKDSLNDEQLEIKRAAVEKRRGIFYVGVAVATLLVLIFNPFKSC